MKVRMMAMKWLCCDLTAAAPGHRSDCELKTVNHQKDSFIAKA